MVPANDPTGSLAGIL